MGESSNVAHSTQSVADYLAQLLKDRKQLAAFPNLFLHVERVMDEEIIRVRSNLFHINGTIKQPLELPEADGSNVTLSDKVYVPVKEHPDFNFVGRILGPRGMTAKQLEQETGCKIMVRGRGSMRDKKKEEMNRGKPNWEHLNDELHVLITVEDTENRAQKKLQRAVEEITRLLVPAPDGEDELKKRQLMELAIINGTYRDSTSEWNTAMLLQQQLQQCGNAGSADFLLHSSDQGAPRLLTPAAAAAAAASLSSLISAHQQQHQHPGRATAHHHHHHQQQQQVTLATGPLLLSPRMTAAGATGPTLIGSAQSAGLLTAAVDHPPGAAAMLYATAAPYNAAAAAAAASEYAAHYAAQLAAAEFAAAAAAASGGGGGGVGGGGGEHNGGASCASAVGKMASSRQRVLGQSREHPYRRSGPGC